MLILITIITFICNDNNSENAGSYTEEIAPVCTWQPNRPLRSQSFCSSRHLVGSSKENLFTIYLSLKKDMNIIYYTSYFINGYIFDYRYFFSFTTLVLNKYFLSSQNGDPIVLAVCQLLACCLAGGAQLKCRSVHLQSPLNKETLSSAAILGTLRFCTVLLGN